ncbi:MAG: hypothetical protein LBR33_01555 [Propionibacteriaceae bacterium]|jgi:uncharacterized protein YqeY|nr:hypothetical protein [Propionibacteriaceae bacterium]
MSRLAVLSAAARAELARAIKRRDPAHIAALRSLLARLDNAAAQPARDLAPTVTSAHIAGATAGLGSAEVERRALTDAEVDALLAAEIASRRDQAAQLDTLGHPREAGAARAQADLLARFQTGQGV